jgi:polar amino acid transport system permease protein
VARRQGERAGPPVAGDRRSKILDLGGEGGRSVAVAVVSTLVVFGLIVLLVVNSAGWPEVKQAFFDPDVFRASFPDIADAFLLNVRIFLIAEVFILVAALGIAVLRSLPGPVFFPVRALAVAYTDLFRGIPTILVVYILGFGAPALQIQGVPRDPLFWGIFSLVLVYSAYVAEVYRSGIDSVHPSQEAAARSLGLTRTQSLRYVIVPQAVRRVVPPLLNDFISLQKDVALVAILGPLEAFRQAQIYAASNFNYTPLVAAALLYLCVTVPLARVVDRMQEGQ